jgi:hypothetical protein
LDFGGTQITYAGLEHLARLTQLQRLTVWGKVTDGGVAKLNKMLPNCAGANRRCLAGQHQWQSHLPSSRRRGMVMGMAKHITRIVAVRM